jgi:hypothetical protein
MLHCAIAILLLTLLPARALTACVVPTLAHAEGNSAEWEHRAELLLGSPAEIQLYVQTIREQPFEARTAVLMLRMNGYRAAAVAPEIMAMCDSLQTRLRCDVITLVSAMQIDAEMRLDFLLDRIDDANPEVRKAALTGACNVLASRTVEYRREEVIYRLIVDLDNEDSDVRNAAAMSLGSLRATGAVPDLKRVATDDSTPRVRNSARGAVDAIEGRNSCTCAQAQPIVLP